VIHRECADELLRTTRAVRRRLDLDRRVPLQLLTECVEVALQAPSTQNRQNWAFVLVTDPRKRAALGDIYRRAMAEQAALAATAPPKQLTPAQERSLRSSEWLTENLARVPVHVIPCVKGEIRNVPANMANATLYGSILPAAWSFMLAARARGLGTSWTTLHLLHEDEADALIKLPSDWRQALLIPTAYYRGDTFQPAPRRTPADVIHANEWNG
jgi:nitroreductase